MKLNRKLSHGLLAAQYFLTLSPDLFPRNRLNLTRLNIIHSPCDFLLPRRLDAFINRVIQALKKGIGENLAILRRKGHCLLHKFIEFR